jgi:hypothetical protein
MLNHPLVYKSRKTNHIDNNADWFFTNKADWFFTNKSVRNIKSEKIYSNQGITFKRHNKHLNGISRDF